MSPAHRPKLHWISISIVRLYPCKLNWTRVFLLGMLGLRILHYGIREDAYLYSCKAFVVEKLKARSDAGRDSFEIGRNRCFVFAIDGSGKCCHFGHRKTAFESVRKYLGACTRLKRQGMRETNCRPIHIRPPLEKAQNQRLISTDCGPTQRSGSNLRGNSKISGLRCIEYGAMPTTVSAGMLYPSMTEATALDLGSYEGRGGYSRSVSLITASRYEHVSLALTVGWPN